jgi:hypothetical protein
MPRHVVVDGSNLATEGRSLPSLKQLNEAVLAFMEEHPDDVITVVVDATFGHRIDPREAAEFDAAIENNELVAPPAGAIGRGDAFVLTIADKVQATILSNDSYQEFHGGEYDWLFDEGRLIGGKPVPNVGWVFVPRVPVRGPISRRAVKDARKASKGTARPSSRVGRTGGRASKEASQPMPVPTAPPPGAKGRSGSRSAPAPTVAPETSDEAVAPEPSRASKRPKPAEQTDAPTAARPHMVNDLLPFLGFVERHPVGSSATAIVESYSSHGAYVTLGEARGYVPLRLMADPAPRSAREVMKVGEEVNLVVVSFNATRRSIDLCVPGMEPAEVKALADKPAPAPVKRSRKKAAAAVPVPAPAEVAAEAAAEAAEPAPAVAAAPAKRTRKKAAATTPGAATPEPPAAEPAAVEAPPAPAKRTRKKAAAAELAPVEPVPVEPVATPAPTPAKKAAKTGTRARKKAVAAPDTPSTTDGSDAGAAAPAPTVEPAPAAAKAPAKRTRKKAVPA